MWAPYFLLSLLVILWFLFIFSPFYPRGGNPEKRILIILGWSSGGHWGSSNTYIFFFLFHLVYKSVSALESLEVLWNKPKLMCSGELLEKFRLLKRSLAWKEFHWNYVWCPLVGLGCWILKEEKYLQQKFSQLTRHFYWILDAIVRPFFFSLKDEVEQNSCYVWNSWKFNCVSC